MAANLIGTRITVLNLLNMNNYINPHTLEQIRIVLARNQGIEDFNRIDGMRLNALVFPNEFDRPGALGEHLELQ